MSPAILPKSRVILYYYGIAIKMQKVRVANLYHPYTTFADAEELLGSAGNDV
jgi:hypothetical protein